MGNKSNIPAGVRAEFDDVDYWRALLKSKEMVTLPNGKEVTVYEWMKKFMHEAYGNNFSRKFPENNILQTEEHKKWARRNNNNTNRDALNVGNKSGKNIQYDLIENFNRRNHPREEWEALFATHTNEETFTQLVEVSCNELGIKFTRKSITAIINIYVRVSKFIRMVRKDKKNEQA